MGCDADDDQKNMKTNAGEWEKNIKWPLIPDIPGTLTEAEGLSR